LKHFIYFFSLFALLLSSCESESKPVPFKTHSIESNYDADISVTFDEAIGNNELSKTINLKIEQSIITSLSEDSIKTNIESVLNDFNSEYLRFKKEFHEASNPPWELHIETEKIYQSEDILTFTINTYQFKGGAHGNDKIKFLNLNAKTGAVLSHNDIIKNLKDFKILAKKHFIKSLESDNDTINMEDFFFGKPFQLPENIGFSEDGLVLLYNVYEIASYNQGYTEFVIPFNEAEIYLKVN
jgi:hypothetical protein